MPTVEKCVVRIHAGSGLPADAVENVFFLQTAAGFDATDADNAVAALAYFYNSVGTGQTIPLKDFMTRDEDYTSNVDEVLFYRMPDAPGPTGSPEFMRNWTLVEATAAQQPLPEQVAVVESFHADVTGIVESVGGTRPRARRRGRIYFGPLSVAALEESSTGTGPQTVSSSLMTEINAASKYLRSNLAALDLTWVVFSTVDWVGRAVVGGFCDDRFDTQRRRLRKADSRLSWTA